MATAKQLAALAKARKARAAKAKKKAPVKRKTPVKRKSTSANTASHYVIYTTVNRKKYYFTGSNLDTELSKARTYANKHIADAAIEIAKGYGGNFKAEKKS